MRKKTMKRFGETKNVRCKTKVTLGMKTQQKVQFRSGWFLFALIKKNLSKVANLDRKICKKEAMKGKLGKDSNKLSIENKQMQAQQSQATQALQQQQAQVLAFFFTSKVVKWFISSEICQVLLQRLYLIFAFVHKKTLFHKILFNFLG